MDRRREPGSPRWELGALHSTRRSLVVVSAVLVLVLTLLSAGTAFGRLTGAERAVLVLAVGLAVVGLVGSRRPVGLWLLAASMAVLVVGSFLDAPPGHPWIALAIVLGYVAYYTVLLTPRWIGLVIALAAPALLAIVWAQEPTNVLVGNMALFHGWGQVAQLGTSAVLLWIVWNRLVVQADQVDTLSLHERNRADDFIRQQERARLWRLTAVRLHESVLNSIRYVLTSPDIDRARLAEEVRRGQQATLEAPGSASSSLAAVVAALKEDPEAGAAITVAGQVPEVALDEAAFDAVRAAAIELARNARRHAEVSSIDVAASTTPGDDAVISLRYLGDQVPAFEPAGVGRSKVVDETLASVGGRYDLERSGPEVVATIRVPGPAKPPARSPSHPFAAFDKARLLVTSILVGSCLAGSAYFVALATQGLSLGGLVAVIGLVGIATAAVLALGHRRVAPWHAVPLALVPALVPWLLLSAPDVCSSATYFAPVVGVAGSCLMIIAAWSGRPAGIIGVLLWGAGGILLVLQTPLGCRDSLIVALLNSLVAVPVIFAVSYSGARAYQRAHDRAEAERERAVAEQTRATAANDINDQLQSAVSEAERLLLEVAAGAEVEGDLRAALQRVDGRIRAGIQVDPRSDGSLAVLAKEAVDAADAAGVAVRVRAIACSTDARPLPREVVGLVHRVLTTPVTPLAQLQVLTDGTEDYLSLMTSANALNEAALTTGTSVSFGDAVVEVDDADSPELERRTILVSRVTEH